jgi:amidase
MLSDTLDHIGPMARTAEDAAAILAVIAGQDEHDHHTALDPVPDYLAELVHGVAGLRIGWDETYCSVEVDPVVTAGVQEALGVLEQAGAEVVEVTLPDTSEVIANWAVLCAAETAVAHEDTYPSRADAYGPELAGFIDSGINATSLDVARANICRNHWRGTLARLFQRVDLIIAPAFSLVTPPEAAIRELAAEEDGLVKLTRYTAPYDLSGSPTISMPCGFGAGSVPLGFQLIGRDFGEDVLLRAAHAYQQRTDWHERHPSL